MHWSYEADQSLGWLDIYNDYTKIFLDIVCMKFGKLD